MRIQILPLLAIIGVPFSTCAQRLEASKVPQTIITAFEKNYPGITPLWEFEDGSFDAEFKQNGKKIEILYDRKGNSSQKIDADNVPAEMKNYINSYYRGEKIRKTKKLVSANGDTKYLAIVGNKTLIFYNNGKFIEVIKN
jgi:hypothetical protein